VRSGKRGGGRMSRRTPRARLCGRRSQRSRPGARTSDGIAAGRPGCFNRIPAARLHRTPADEPDEFPQG
jgi:hypothetical protein